MINGNEIRRIAAEEGLDTSMLEKDYVLGWMLYGISQSSVGKRLAFKGGTALSKIYYPCSWRLSEDLDFTLLVDTDWEIIIDALKDEVPVIIKESAGINVSLRPKPHTNPEYLQARIKYLGPTSPNTIKVEMTKEKFAGDIIDKDVPVKFDYPEFTVRVYSIDNIIAEKMRAIIQRGYIRDYYDVWKLLRKTDYNAAKTRELFEKKCNGKGIKYSDTKQFFPKDIEKNLAPYVETGLGRLMRDDLLPIGEMLAELRRMLEKTMS